MKDFIHALFKVLNITLTIILKSLFLLQPNCFFLRAYCSRDAGFWRRRFVLAVHIVFFCV